MEPRNETVSTPNEPTQAQGPEGRKPRFQVIKVEDSIAEAQGMNPTHGHCATHGCYTHRCRCRCGR